MIRVDILHEVSVLSAYQASSQKGNLEQLIHICNYLNKKPKLTLYFNLQHLKIYTNTFNRGIKEALRDQYRVAN